MQSAFLIIISLLASGYAFVTKQQKLGLGFLVIALSFIIALPMLATGFWSDFLSALSLLIFLIGVIIIVWRSKIKEQNHDQKAE